MKFPHLHKHRAFSKFQKILTMSNIFLCTYSENSPYILNTFSLPGDVSLSNRRLDYSNDVFYPETEYNSESKTRIFNDIMT